MAKTKQQKRKARERRLKKERNVRRNSPSYKFKLEVNDPEKGWYTAMGFKNDSEVDIYLEEHKKIREENSSDIIEGRIINLKTGRHVAHIPAHKSKMAGDRDTSGDMVAGSPTAGPPANQ